jgi:replicative DNA helicase
MRISRKSATQQLGIAEIGRGIKALAKELEIPIMVLSQFHRGIENRSNKRPIMSDLRDSGTIEEDADLILFLYREGYYSELEHERLNGRTELNVAKQRGGAVGMLPLNLDMKSGSFTGLTH